MPARSRARRSFDPGTRAQARPLVRRCLRWRGRRPRDGAAGRRARRCRRRSARSLGTPRRRRARAHLRPKTTPCPRPHRAPAPRPRAPPVPRRAAADSRRAPSGPRHAISRSAPRACASTSPAPRTASASAGPLDPASARSALKPLSTRRTAPPSTTPSVTRAPPRSSGSSHAAHVSPLSPAASASARGLTPGDSATTAPLARSTIRSPLGASCPTSVRAPSRVIASACPRPSPIGLHASERASHRCWSTLAAPATTARRSASYTATAIPPIPERDCRDRAARLHALERRALALGERRPSRHRAPACRHERRERESEPELPTQARGAPALAPPTLTAPRPSADSTIIARAPATSTPRTGPASASRPSAPIAGSAITRGVPACARARDATNAKP